MEYTHMCIYEEISVSHRDKPMKKREIEFDSSFQCNLGTY